MSSIHAGSLFFAEMSRTTASESRAGRWRRDVGVRPAVAVAAQRGDGLRPGSVPLFQPAWPRDGLILCWTPGLMPEVVAGNVTVSGTWVVQAQSPLTMDASRWTWVPRTSEMASCSAWQSSGNSSATWETGQWCWQISMP